MLPGREADDFFLLEDEGTEIDSPEDDNEWEEFESFLSIH